jgi:hypothetical protein
MPSCHPENRLSKSHFFVGFPFSGEGVSLSLPGNWQAFFSHVEMPNLGST